MHHLSRETFKTGLSHARTRKTAHDLGDRTAYVGASDIGRCPRQAVLSKTLPRAPGLSSLIRFERGHIAEEIVAAALEDAQPVRQLELAADLPYCPHCYWWDFYTPPEPKNCPVCGDPLAVLPLKAHCDFVFDDDIVLECKSSGLAEIQKSWEMQLQAQLLLYKHCLQKEPSGVILVIDIARGALEITDSYAPDLNMADNLVRRTIAIWEGMAEASYAPEPEAVIFNTEAGPLCGSCDYLRTCLAFAGKDLPTELVDYFEQYADLCRTEKEAKAQKEALRGQILEILTPGKYTAGDLRISLAERNRTSTDMKALAALLEELGQDITTFQRKTPYPVLDVKTA
jgi:CRISPR-associated exonuclease Cas4